uniref:Large ribosomal subunit protein uL29m n=1 Tax=Blastobotrys adeninivorans TaxID=409370 RepID=A0A060SZ54_BLAAD
MMSMKRAFHTTAQVCGRARPKHVKFDAPKLRPPVPPTVKNLKVPEDHPLWQFFSDKKYLRPFSDLENTGRAWTVQELRRKSFDDLHTLWYVCLKERNILLRESQIYKTLAGPQAESNDRYKTISEEIRNTMWRIRHVLAERHRAWVNGMSELKNSYNEIAQEFEARYLSADAGRDVEMEAQLERFQYMMFGLNPMLAGNEANENVLRGLKKAATLRLKRFGSDQTEVDTVNDINEAFVLFTADHSPEGIADAIKTIKQYRAAGKGVSKDQEMSVLRDLVAESEKLLE